MRKTLFIAILTSGFAAPALSQPAEKSFTGPRIEGLVGYDRVQLGSDFDVAQEEGGDDSVDGLTYGAAAGFDFDLRGIIIGIEGEFSDTTGRQDVEGSIDGANFAARFKVGNDLYVGGRLGFRATPSTLVYGKAGYTNVDVDASLAFNGADFGLEPGLNSFTTDAVVRGYRLGAGVEHLFGPNLYGKLEYRYSNYSRVEFDEAFTPRNGYGIDGDRHQAVVGLGVRF